MPRSVRSRPDPAVTVPSKMVGRGAVSTQAQNLAAHTGRPARRPWTRVGAVAVAAHVFYELVDGEQVEGAEFTPDVENELWRREQAVAQRAAQTRPSTSCAVAWNRVSRSEKVIASLRKLSEWGQLARGPQAAGPNRHGLGQQALDQVVGGILEGGPVAVGETAKTQTPRDGRQSSGGRCAARIMEREREPERRGRRPAVRRSARPRGSRGPGLRPGATPFRLGRGARPSRRSRHIHHDVELSRPAARP